MQNKENRFNISYLRENAERILVNRGLGEKEAFILVDTMLEADKCGVGTHGIRMLSSYLKKIEEGYFSYNSIEFVKSNEVLSIIDAKNNIGAISAFRCTEIAIEKAKRYGLHTVFSRGCNTFGPAFYYVEKMATEGLIGFVCCNSPAAMPAYNGLEAMLGTNPLAFACPSKNNGSIVIDMATSIVAKSKFQTAFLNGDMLSEGWALDKNGVPTTDPVEAIKGFVLPMAGFKGYGISMMIDIMSGLLSGAAYSKNVHKFYSNDGNGMNVGQMFVAFDPDAIYGENFYNEVDAYIDLFRNSKSVSGKQVIIPGDDRMKEKKYSESYGVALSDDTVAELNKLFNVGDNQ